MAYQEFNGIRFYRSSTTGYWERARGVPRKMHVYVWEFYNKCRLPDGYCIHHKDKDRGNNSIENLELMNFSEHAQHHAKEKDLTTFVAKSKEWHSSKTGMQHHRENGLTTSSQWPTKEYTCIECGNKFVMKSPRTDYKFCCNACRASFRRKSGVDNEERKCVVCGETFVVNRYRKTICCSRACSAALRQHKKY